MFTIRGMTIADIPAGLRLKEQAGWNQTEADWRRLLDLQPDGCFLAEWDAVPVGTVTTCRFGEVAWIAMMLVDENYRRRGIGRALMSRALESLEEAGVRSIRLDATPQGRPLYETLGFEAEATFDRFQGVLPRSNGMIWTSGVQPGRADDGVLAFDREVTGTDRGRLIRCLDVGHCRAFKVVETAEGVSGFLTSRPGSKARQIGPCVADERAGPLLLTDAARRYASRLVLLDIPTVNTPARNLVESWGLRAERTMIRMGRGPRVVEDLGRIWAGSGPEKG